MMRRTALVAPLVLLACSSSSSTPSGSAPDDAGDARVDAAPAVDPSAALADKLTTWLAGRFDSKDQAKKDKQYFAITLDVCRADVPELGPRVLYVEQARAGMAPYRQRLYVVEPIDATKARSRVFELKKPDAAVGACTRGAPPTFAAGDAEPRDGCEVVLAWNEDRFQGGTPEKKCTSTLEGASYATTEVTLRRDGLTSWDRGWDASGKQVWGAVAGGYEFLRRSSAPE